MKPLSKSVPTLLSKAFARKYIALGRIVTHWNEIIGEEFSQRAQPAKIQYFKPKSPKEKAQATLEIAASSADCAVLVYQKDVILQRINQIFGDSWVKDIKFVHIEPKLEKKVRKPTKSLTEEQKNYLSHMLDAVVDPDIKERLSRIGQSILQEKKQ